MIYTYKSFSFSVLLFPPLRPLDIFTIGVAFLSAMYQLKRSCLQFDLDLQADQRTLLPSSAGLSAAGPSKAVGNLTPGKQCVYHESREGQQYSKDYQIWLIHD